MWLTCLVEQRCKHRAPLGDSEPAGNVTFDQSPDYRGGDSFASDACVLPVSMGGNAEQQKALGTLGAAA
jgi:hypothetical protein